MFVLTVKTKINNKKKFLFMCAFGLILILAAVFVSCDNTPKSAYCKEIGEYSLSFSTSNDKKLSCLTLMLPDNLLLLIM